MSRFKLSNIPIPQCHVISLLAGIALHCWRPLELWQAVWQRQVSDWTLLLIGALLAIWAAATFKQMDFGIPSAITTTGPYAFSRNPMYRAWTLTYLTIPLLVNTWLVVYRTSSCDRAHHTLLRCL